MIESAVRATQRQTEYAIEHGEPMYAPCSCHIELDRQRCDCRVELAMGKAWMRQAAERLVKHEFVGRPPKRRCQLCRAGDHDLADTYEMTVKVAGDPRVGSVRVIAPRGRRSKLQLERAARAGAHPPGSWAAQRRAAGIED